MKEKVRYMTDIPQSEFLALDVPWYVTIKEFVEEMCHLEFQPGRGFYQFTKTELIRENTEIILRDKKTGRLSGGGGARNLIGLFVGQRTKCSPPKGKDFDIFVQSNSLNRRLIGGTELLYRIKEES
jgi:hypothetical protein